MTAQLSINGRKVEAPITRAVLLGVLYVVGPLALTVVFLAVLVVVLLMLPFIALAALVDVATRGPGSAS